MIFFANHLDCSSWAAAPLGPKAAMSAALSASTIPAASGSSGPTATKSIPSRRAAATTPEISVAAMSRFVPSNAVPALPGAQRT